MVYGGADLGVGGVGVDTLAKVKPHIIGTNENAIQPLNRADSLDLRQPRPRFNHRQAHKGRICMGHVIRPSVKEPARGAKTTPPRRRIKGRRNKSARLIRRIHQGANQAIAAGI